MLLKVAVARSVGDGAAGNGCGMSGALTGRSRAGVQLTQLWSGDYGPRNRRFSFIPITFRPDRPLLPGTHDQ